MYQWEQITAACSPSFMFSRKKLSVVLAVLLVGSFSWARMHHPQVAAPYFPRPLATLLPRGMQQPQIAPLSSHFKKLTKCEIHNTQLQMGTASILYGKRNYPVPELIYSRQFPHGETYALGGCTTSPDSPTLQAIKFCPRCRALEQRWLNAHKPLHPNP